MGKAPALVFLTKKKLISEGLTCIDHSSSKKSSDFHFSVSSSQIMTIIIVRATHFEYVLCAEIWLNVLDT